VLVYLGQILQGRVKDVIPAAPRDLPSYAPLVIVPVSQLTLMLFGGCQQPMMAVVKKSLSSGTKKL
jgi:hypothetical protein